MRSEQLDNIVTLLRTTAAERGEVEMRVEGNRLVFRGA